MDVGGAGGVLAPAPEATAFTGDAADTPSADAAQSADAARSADAVQPADVGGPTGPAWFDVSQFVKPSTPTCLKTFKNTVKVKPGVITGYKGNPPPNTVVDMRGVTIKFAPPGESAWGPNYSDNVCVVGGKFVGQSARTIGWEESKTNYDGSGIRVGHLQGPFIWENVIFDNSHDGIMLPRSPTPLTAKGIVRGVMVLYNRDDCIETDGSTSVYVEDSFFECNTFFSATGGSGVGRELVMKNSLVQMKCLPDYRTKKHPCAGFSPRSATAQLWKGIKPEMKLRIEDSIIYQEDRTKNGLSGMVLQRNAHTTFKNVIIIWGGAGAWPGPDKPPGVTITKDKTIWHIARAEWMKQHGCQGNDCTFKSAGP